MSDFRSEYERQSEATIACTCCQISLPRHRPAARVAMPLTAAIVGTHARDCPTLACLTDCLFAYTQCVV